MTAPALAAQRFWMACLVGAGLGLVYGFLRPLRPRHTALADGLFVAVAFGGWLYLSFGICQGDLRLAYGAGMLLGGIIWEGTVGRLLRLVFSGFWKIIRGIWRFLLMPLKKISKFVKILFASGEKWVTIK